MQLTIGPDAISSYKRLAYTAWHAIAEFVDNSTQCYFDNKGVLDAEYAKTGEKLEVTVSYDKDQGNGWLRVYDNALGMSLEQLEDALHVAKPPKNTNGRCKYGMGMKTASCWIGNTWVLRTKKLGETVEREVTVDVSNIEKGDNDLKYHEIPNKDPGAHYTVIEVFDHNRKWVGRTLGKIKDFLGSMYRKDLESGLMQLTWRDQQLSWDGLEKRLLKSKTGSTYRKDFTFKVDGKEVKGWVGILDPGSRADAGFSMIHSGRVIYGWPEAWRPQSIFGQLQGSNDLVNQRLVGEIHLDPFDVTHTKDDILWLGTQEEDVEAELKKVCAEYIDFAKKKRKGQKDQRGPSELAIKQAVDDLKKELQSPEMVDQITIETIPSEEVIREANRKAIAAVVKTQDETLTAEIKGFVTVKLFLTHNSEMDYYVRNESTSDTEVIVLVNAEHPYMSQLSESQSVLDYLRQCIYDGICEWQARKKAARIDPDTIKILKDRLLRVPMEIEQHEGDADQPPADDQPAAEPTATVN